MADRHARTSGFTDLATLFGWFQHVWLWLGLLDIWHTLDTRKLSCQVADKHFQLKKGFLTPSAYHLPCFTVILPQSLGDNSQRHGLSRRCRGLLDPGAQRQRTHLKVAGYYCMPGARKRLALSKCNPTHCGTEVMHRQFRKEISPSQALHTLQIQDVPCVQRNLIRQAGSRCQHVGCV